MCCCPCIVVTPFILITAGTVAIVTVLVRDHYTQYVSCVVFRNLEFLISVRNVSVCFSDIIIVFPTVCLL